MINFGAQLAEGKDYARRADSKDAELQALKLELADIKSAKPAEVRLRTELDQLKYVASRA